MYKIEESLIINQPVEEVFNFVLNADNEPLRQTQIQVAKVTSGDPIGLGLTIQEAKRREGAWWLVPIMHAIGTLAFMILRREFKTVVNYLEGKVVVIGEVISKHELLS